MGTGNVRQPGQADPFRNREAATPAGWANQEAGWVPPGLQSGTVPPPVASVPVTPAAVPTTPAPAAAAATAPDLSQRGWRGFTEMPNDNPMARFNWVDGIRPVRPVNDNPNRRLARVLIGQG